MFCTPNAARLARISFSIFAAPDRLDETSGAVWEFFPGASTGAKESERRIL